MAHRWCFDNDITIDELGSAIIGYSASNPPINIDSLVSRSVDGNIELSFTDISVDAANLSLAEGGFLTVGLTDILDPESFYLEHNLDVSGLPNFDPAQLINTLRSLENALAGLGDVGDLGIDIPMIGQSIGDLVDMSAQLKSVLDVLDQNDSLSFDNFETEFDALMPDDAGFTLSYDEVNDEVLVSLLVSEGGTTELPLNFDFADLGVAGFPSLFSSESSLDVTAGATIDVHLALDLETGDVDLLDNTLIDIDLAVAGSPLNFQAALGPLGVFVQNGEITLADSEVSVDVLERTPLASFPSGESIDFTPTINSTTVWLPIHFPTEGGAPVCTLGVEIPNIFSPGSPSVSGTDCLDAEIGSLDLLSNLDVIATGLDWLLEKLQDGLNSSVFSNRLPLIGDKLGAAAQFIEELRANQIADLKDALAAPAIASDVRGTLFQLFSNAGILMDQDGDGLSVNDVLMSQSSEEVRFEILLGQGTLASLPLNFDLGVDSIGLTGDAQLDVNVGYQWRLGFGVNKTHGFFIDTELDADPTDAAVGELVVAVEATIPDSEFEGRLGFLTLAAKDNSADPTSFSAGIVVDLLDPQEANPAEDADGLLTVSELGSATLGDLFQPSAQIDVGVNLDLRLSIADSELAPSLATEFYLNWSMDTLDMSTASNPPQIGFNNVRVDMGEFMTRFASPILERVRSVTDILKPVVDVLQTPTPVISDIGLLVNLMDIDNDDAVSILELYAHLNPDAPEAINYILDFLKIYTLVENVTELLPENPHENMEIVLGNLDLSDTDFRVNDFSSISDNPEDLLALLTGAGGSIEDQIDGYVSAQFEDAPEFLQRAKTFFENAADDGGFVFGEGSGFGEGEGASEFEFPIIQSPTEAFMLLLGKDPSLATFDLQPLRAGIDYYQFVPLFWWLGIEIEGGVGIEADLAFGYDIRGIRQFAESLQAEAPAPEKLLNGFFISDRENPNGTGPDVPEASITGFLNLAGALNAVVASASIGGGFKATADANLNDLDGDGKFRGDELLATLPKCMIDLSGELAAEAKARVKLGLGKLSVTRTWQVARRVMASFQHSCDPEPILAEYTGDGILELNIGDRASRRNYGDQTDGDEVFELTHVGGVAGNETVMVSAFGYSQEYSGVSQIRANGNEGNDQINVGPDVQAAVKFFGGIGDDILSAGAGPAELNGGDGNDQLTGGPSDDFMLGGAGDDLLSGREGRDHLDGGVGHDNLFGDEGEDTLIGGPNDDFLSGGPDDDDIEGGSGNDELDGDSGDDILRGEDGDDTISGGDGDDFIDAGSDNDEILAGFGDDTVKGGSGRDLIFGGPGADDIDGGTDDDQIEGEDDNDTLRGNSGNDLVNGGSGNDEIRGGSGNDELIGADGDDNILGDGGHDTIFGDDESGDAGAGSDTLRGGLGDDVMWGGPEHDTMHGDGGNDMLNGQDGNDVMHGDGGQDLLDGEMGDDEMHGGNGIDLLLGRSGNDVMNGGAGDDEIRGDIGNDQIDGGPGRDQLFGDAGDDTIHGGYDSDLIIGDEGSDNLFGGWGDDKIFGKAPGDQDSTDLEYIEGGPNDDFICGTHGEDGIFGGTADAGYTAFIAPPGGADGPIPPTDPLPGGFLVTSCQDDELPEGDFPYEPDVEDDVDSLAAAVHGTSFLDINGNGVQEGIEPGIGGIAVYADVNHDGSLTPGEPFVQTDVNGHYQLNLLPGDYSIREALPAGLLLTSPATSAHDVVLSLEDVVEGVDFGNAQPSGISGSAWIDINGDGQRDVSEPHQSGVTVYIDANLNGEYDAGIDPFRLTAPDGSYVFAELLPGEYIVREVVPDSSIPTLPTGYQPHHVQVLSGLTTTDVNFGNFENHEVEGEKWMDLDGSGMREPNEPGIGGVTIYVDANDNSQFDDGELFATTMDDDPLTQDVDETGHYRILRVPRGTHRVREVVPPRYEQTWPKEGAYLIDAGVSGLDFGNRPTGDIHGTVWVDLDGDGGWDTDLAPEDTSASEPGLAGVIVYVDEDGDGQRDGTERFAITQADDPATVADETGRYSLTGLSLGKHIVRQENPGGFTRSFPVSFEHVVLLDSATFVEDVDFGNFQHGEVHGLKWVDSDGNGMRDPDEPGLAGVVIYSDLNNNGLLDATEPSTLTQVDDPATRQNEAGTYELSGLLAGQHTIRELTPAGYRQTTPTNRAGTAIGYTLDIRPGSIAENYDFGNEPAIGNISGLVWHDRDTDGRRDSNEPGLAGVTIYLDLNRNDVLDDDEPFTQTRVDDPTTFFNNEAGTYGFVGLEARQGGQSLSYLVNAIAPARFSQTSPGPNNPHDIATVPLMTVENVSFAMVPSRQLLSGASSNVDDGTDTLEFSPIPEFAIESPTLQSGDQGAVGKKQLVKVSEPLQQCTAQKYSRVAAAADQAEEDVRYDFGDLPGTYPTTLSDNGARHAVLNGNPLRLGTHVDSEPDGMPHVDALGDDLSNQADEDGVTFLSPLKKGETAAIRVTASQTGFLSAWLDANGDGDWNDFGERIITAQGISTGATVLNFQVPMTTTPAELVEQTGVRFRFSSEQDVSYVGSAPNGEVEDYLVSVAPVDWPGWQPRVQVQNGSLVEGDSGVVFMAFDVSIPGPIDHPVTVAFETSEDSATAGTDYIESSGEVAIGVGETSTEILVPIYGDFAQEGDEFFELRLTQATGAQIANETVTGRIIDDDTANGDGSITGLKWLDVNQNAVRDADEPGWAGVTVYVDVNENGQLDIGEPFAESESDHPATEFVETGRYRIEDLPPGDYVVREVIPEGWTQTFPSSEFHEVNVGLGDSIPDIDFGNVVLLPDGDDTVFAGAADDNVYGDNLVNRPEVVSSGTRQDELWGEAGMDNLFGQERDDQLAGGEGDDALDGGDGIDRVFQMVDNDQVLTNSTLTGQDVVDTLVSIERATLIGGPSDNNIDASAFEAGPVILIGLGGDDVLTGSEFNDELHGGDGNDEMAGGNGDDLYIFESVTTGIAEDDTLNEEPDGGRDTLDFSSLPNPDALTLDLSETDSAIFGNHLLREVFVHESQLDLQPSFEIVFGGNGNDVITGNDSDNDLFGNAGVDQLLGEAGNDSLSGRRWRRYARRR